MGDRSTNDAERPVEPPGQGGEWVALEEAAALASCPEEWLMDRCRDGRLPSRQVAGAGLVVPLTTARALAAGRISD
jgi:hypothetical protein